MRYSKKDCLEAWGLPETINDVSTVFKKYVNSEIPFLPWSDTALSIESDMIRTNLISLNQRGFLTINSQPSVDGVPSSDKNHGWGPKNGYVYQKAYLEFFVCPIAMQQLITLLDKSDTVTYFAVNQQGDLKTNNKQEGANAVTWGVFPGQEIVL